MEQPNPSLTLNKLDNKKSHQTDYQLIQCVSLMVNFNFNFRCNKMEETEGETTEETIYVYQYPGDGQGEEGGVEARVINVGAKECPSHEEEVTTVTQYVEEVVEIDNENVVVANVMAATEKGSIKLVLSEEDSNPAEHGYTMNYRPIRPVERQKMRPWLLEHLDQGSIPGLSWQNRTQRIFRISWKHAAHNCFNRTRDSDLFERWAYHTGKVIF